MDMAESTSSEWYATWFDSPHYHRLYGHRSTEEADLFIDNLHAHFSWSGLRLLDLACGKGRHAAAAAQRGHRVTGVDLSPQSIDAAKSTYREVPGLDFATGDMRRLALEEQFDGVLNLFTSFGYFDRSEDHLAVLQRIHSHLKPGGFLILDFLDIDFAKDRLVAEEHVQRGDFTYEIRRQFGPLPGGMNGFTKRISFHEGGRDHHYKEQVAGLSVTELTRMLTACGFEIQGTFGNYQLDPWEPGISPRAILHATRS